MARLCTKAQIVDVERGHCRTIAARRLQHHLRPRIPKAMKTKKLLFLGDFVDRGPASLEVALYVMTLKVLYPGHVHLLRGNHETDPVSQDYGFKAQCQALFGTTRGNRVWWMVGRVFDDLPLAAVVDGKIFCSHGGIPQGEDGDDRMAFLSNAALWSKFRKEQYRATVGPPTRHGTRPRPALPPPPPPLSRGLLEGEGGCGGQFRSSYGAVRGGCESGWGRLVAVGNAVGAGVGVWECLWGRVRAGVLGGRRVAPLPSSDSLPPAPPPPTHTALRSLRACASVTRQRMEMQCLPWCWRHRTPTPPASLS